MNKEKYKRWRVVYCADLPPDDLICRIVYSLFTTGQVKAGIGLLKATKEKN